MANRVQWAAYFLVGVVGLFSELAWGVLSAFFESDSARVSTPALSLLGALVFAFYLRRSAWIYKWSPYYGLGAALVMFRLSRRVGSALRELRRDNECH